eukprot:TRINITY_DN6393_c0_g1_i2.p1 TRINITY_DN6393_c0_g1~~TRINITY_DN6393_c0_g1_i2.p1  ORF type:complete len:256 (-),score=25.71 TRINITY_DN6393_c0_g1_i2:122-889(-)
MALKSMSSPLRLFTSKAIKPRRTATATTVQRKRHLSSQSSEPTTHVVPRLFAAIFPPVFTLDHSEALQQHLHADFVSAILRWKPRSNFQITLRFFGGLLKDEKHLAVANQIMTEVAARIDPFEVELYGVDVFPRWSKPRILWVGVNKGKKELNYLMSELEKEWDKAGIPDDEPKRPHKTHLTLGRWSDITPDTFAADQMRNTCAGVNWVSSFRVKELLMMNSTLEPEAPVYSPIYLAPLRDSAEPLRRRARYAQK